MIPLFNSGYVEIATCYGNKWIKDIQVGDLVLCDNAYRPVMAKHKIPTWQMDEDVLDIYYCVEDEEGKYREDGVHRIGSNSLVLSGGKFKKAKYLCINDILNLKKDKRGKVVEILPIPIKGTYFYGLEIEKAPFYYADEVVVGTNLKCIKSEGK